MLKIIILSKTKHLQEALNSTNFFKGYEITTLTSTKDKADLLIIDDITIDQSSNAKIPKIKLSKSHGADLTKPIKLVNLINLIRTKLENKEPIATFAGLIFNMKKKQVSSKESNHISLTAKEAQILTYLINNSTKESTSEQILKDVWGISKKLNTRTIETHIYSLRKKLSQLHTSDLIQTGVKGYILK